MLHLWDIIYQHSWSCASLFQPTGMNCELHLCSNVLGHLWEHFLRNGALAMDFCIMTSLLLSLLCAEISQLKYITIPSVHPQNIPAWLLPKDKLVCKNRFSRDQRQITDYLCRVKALNISTHFQKWQIQWTSCISVSKNTPLKRTAWNLLSMKKKFHPYKFFIIPHGYVAVHACSQTHKHSYAHCHIYNYKQ